MDEPHTENPIPPRSDLSDPELAESEPQHGRWQFSLMWLFMLMTIVAAFAAMIRLAMVHPLFLLPLFGCAVLSIFYLLFWLPTMYFFGPKLRQIQEDRRTLNQWANWRRQAKRAEEVSRDE